MAPAFTAIEAREKAALLLKSLHQHLNNFSSSNSRDQLAKLISNFSNTLPTMGMSSPQHQKSFIDNFKQLINDQDDLSQTQKQSLTNLINGSSFVQSMQIAQASTNESRALTKRKPINFSSLPGKVNARDLHQNNKLLSDDEIRKVSKKFAGIKNKSGEIVHLSKKKLGTKYSVIEANNQLYAIYSGVKSGKELGAGNFGSVKLAQNLQSGEWSVLKVQSATNTEGLRTETEASKATGLAIAAGISVSKEKGGRHRMLMNLVKGESLDNFLKTQGHMLSFSEKINLTYKILDAFHHIHNQQITHGDTEARNIMINSSNPQDLKISLIDYGSASINTTSDKTNQFNKAERNEVRQVAIHLVAKLLDVEFVPIALGGGYKNTPDYNPNRLSSAEIDVRNKLTQVLDKMITGANRPNIQQVIDEFKLITNAKNEVHLNHRR